MDAFDYPSDPQAPTADAASLMDGMGSPDTSSAEDAATADAFMSDDVSVSGHDSAGCGSCDAMQVEDAPDVAPASSGAGSSGTSSGSASGSGSGFNSGSGGTSGTNSDSGSRSDSAGLPCAAVALTPLMAVASSAQTAPIGYPVNLAIDGNFDTRWGSALQVDPSWIYVDYGNEVFVGEVDILWQAACGANYEMDVSNDTTTWTPLKSVMGNDTGATTTPSGWNDPAAVKFAGLTGRGRYLRIYGTVRCQAAFGYSIWEMRALGDTDSNCTLP